MQAWFLRILSQHTTSLIISVRQLFIRTLRLITPRPHSPSRCGCERQFSLKGPNFRTRPSRVTQLSRDGAVLLNISASVVAKYHLLQMLHVNWQKFSQ